MGIIDPEKRLLTKRKITENGCWEWTGCINSGGYGHTKYKYRQLNVSRLAAFLWLGLDLDAGNMYVCHKRGCNNKLCFNPEHLYIGNNSTNQQDYRWQVRHYGRK
jgi:hypothetical protein